MDVDALWVAHRVSRRITLRQFLAQVIGILAYVVLGVEL